MIPEFLAVLLPEPYIPHAPALHGAPFCALHRYANPHGAPGHLLLPHNGLWSADPRAFEQHPRELLYPPGAEILQVLREAEQGDPPELGARRGLALKRLHLSSTARSPALTFAICQYQLLLALERLRLRRETYWEGGRLFCAYHFGRAERLEHFRRAMPKYPPRAPVEIPSTPSGMAYASPAWTPAHAAFVAKFGGAARRPSLWAAFERPEPCNEYLVKEALGFMSELERLSPHGQGGLAGAPSGAVELLSARSGLREGALLLLVEVHDPPPAPRAGLPPEGPAPKHSRVTQHFGAADA